MFIETYYSHITRTMLEDLQRLSFEKLSIDMCYFPVLLITDSHLWYLTEWLMDIFMNKNQTVRLKYQSSLDVVWHVLVASSVGRHFDNVSYTVLASVHTPPLQLSVFAHRMIDETLHTWRDLMLNGNYKRCWTILKKIRIRCLNRVSEKYTFSL